MKAIKKLVSMVLIAALLIGIVPSGNPVRAARALKDNLNYRGMFLDDILKEGENSLLQIELRDDNYNEYEYQWEFRPFGEQDTDSWIELTEKGDDSDYLIEDFALDKVGEYRCHVTGKSSVEYETVVFNRSFDIKLSWEKYYEEDESYTYYCAPSRTITLKLNQLTFENGYEVSYKWFHEGKILSGKTGESLSLTVQNEGDTGMYTCQVILRKDGKVFRISAQDMYVYIEASIACDYTTTNFGKIGKTVNLNVFIEYSYPEDMNVTYQWEKYNEETKAYDTIPGATRDIYSANIKDTNDFGKYRCIVSGGKDSEVFCKKVCEMELRSKMNLEVYGDYYVEPFELFELEAWLDLDQEEDYSVSYQWYKGSISPGNALSGETSALLTATADALDKYATYYCEAKVYDAKTKELLDTYEGYRKVEMSNLFEMSEGASEEEAQRIMIKKDQALLEVPKISFDKTHFSASYQWYKRESGQYKPIQNATGSTYSIDNLQESDAGMLYCVEISLKNQEQVWVRANSYFRLVEDIGLTEEKGERYKFIENGSIPSMKASVSCNQQFKDKLSYQWQGYYDDEEEEFINIKGANAETFCPTKKQSELYRYFRCIVKIGVEGYGAIYTDRVTYMNVDEVIDLTKEAYRDNFSKLSTDYYVRKIIVADDKKAISFTYKNDNDWYYCRLVGKNEKASYFESDMENELTIEGNVVYVINDGWDRYSGFSKVEGKSEFVKSVRYLHVSGSNSYQYGKVINVEELEMYRYYNDGSTEKVKSTELEYGTLDTAKLGVGRKYIELKDLISGKSVEFSIYVWYPIEYRLEKEIPELLIKGKQQKFSVIAENMYNSDEVYYLWKLKDEDGKTIEIIGDDTSSELLLPNLEVGFYEVYCYPYIESIGLQEDEYLYGSFEAVDPNVFVLSSELPESPHSFTAPFKNGYTYRIPNAQKLKVTFDSRTDLDYGDRLYILDNSGLCVSYRYSELAGKTIAVEGDTVRIYASFYKYTEEEYYGWGFKVTNIEGIDMKPPVQSPTPKPTVKPISTTKPSETPVEKKKISVSKAIISSIKGKKKSISLKIKKISGVKGYQVVYAADKKFKKAKKALTIKKQSITIKKLKPKKKYYIKVRAYKTDTKGKKVYGKYSKIKSVKTKKR